MPLPRRTSALPLVSARMALLSVFMAGTCATGALFFLVSRLETRQEERQFHEPAPGRLTAISVGSAGAPGNASDRPASRAVGDTEPLAGNEVAAGMASGFLQAHGVAGAVSMRAAGSNAVVFLADDLFAPILAPTRSAPGPGWAMGVHALAPGQAAEKSFRGARAACEFLPQHHAGSILVLLLGLASTLSAAGYLRKLHRRTQALAQANATLNRDIAERREIAQALARSEDRFRRLVELSSDWYWEQDAAYRFSLLAGRKVREAPGMLARVIGRTRWDVALSAGAEDLAAHRALVEAHQPFQNFEYMLTLGHNQQIWLSVNGEPVFDEEGRFAGYRGTGRDISHRKRSEQALRELTAHRESIKEQERKRIAREIHDELGQTLLALRLDVASLHLRVGGHVRLRERVGLALSQIDITVRAVRNIINDLRPPVLDLGLDAAIEWQVGQFQRRSGIQCHLAWDSGATGLDERVATALFRIVQEALTNVLRHAGASAVAISLGSTPHAVNMTIADNGRGAQPEDCRRAGSFGLAGIRERVVALGGRFDIVSEPGMGLTMLICLPLQQAGHAGPGA